ncbi:hypothetical protein LBMAG53_20430 [Planctomycetota bacterium]|nr:hypothetical protein LBMAG53_20430 [Planctomycetota bacterium]
MPIDQPLQGWEINPILKEGRDDGDDGAGEHGKASRGREAGDQDGMIQRKGALPLDPSGAWNRRSKRQLNVCRSG